MNIFMKQKQTHGHREKPSGCHRVKEGRTESWGLANYHIYGG